MSAAPAIRGRPAPSGSPAPGRPALVLVPGLLCDATIWRHQIAAFAESYDVSIPELAACDSLGGMAEALLAQAPARFALAGHSLGGRVALEVMRRAPARVTRLALFDTGVHACASDEPARRQALVALAFRDGMQALARTWLPPMLHPDRRTDPSLLEPLGAMVTRRTPESFHSQITALLRRPDATRVLHSIACPTLVLCGRQDGWSPLPQHEAIAAAIRGARLAVIEDSGHMAPFEKPEAVTAALRGWLER